MQTKSRSNNSQTSKQCYFCTTNSTAVNYKDGELLRTFLNPQAKIKTRKRTGLCMLHQRKAANAIKRARIMGIVPYTYK